MHSHGDVLPLRQWYAHGVLGAFSSPGSEERNPVGLEPGPERDVRVRVSTEASAHLHVLGGGRVDGKGSKY